MEADTVQVTNFSAKTAASPDKLRGGYYTPDPIARFLAQWVIEAGDRVLEPSCGDGAVLRHLSRLSDQVQGVELLPDEAATASRFAPVAVGDFFEWLGPEDNQAWDGVAGNPPYIRFGNWPEELRHGAMSLMKGVGLKPSRLTNAWVPFVVGSTIALKMGGRLGLVLPAELMQVTYAAQLRDYLVKSFEELTVITFQSLVFEGILQEVVLLLGVRGPGPARIRNIQVVDATSLSSVELAGDYAPALLHDTEKWTKYFLTSDQIECLRRLRSGAGLSSLSTWATVDVGIVTGRNSFFTMTDSEAKTRGLLEHCRPLLSRSAQIKGTVYDAELLKGQNQAGQRVWILDADPNSLEQNLTDYIAQGEAAGVQYGYKCSIRKPWWRTPSMWIPDGFMLRQIHNAPRIASNQTGATSTDTVHRVRTNIGVEAGSLATAFHNSASFAYCEIMGRSYGGGVLELEPREAEGIPMPDPALADERLSEEVDRLVRDGEVAKARDLVDREVLITRLGWSDEDVRHCSEAFERLRDRRAGRGRTTS